MLARVLAAVSAFFVLAAAVPAASQEEDLFSQLPPADPAVQPLVPSFGQQLGWTRYVTAVAGRLPTVVHTHRGHVLVLRFPAAWTLVDVQIGDPEAWTFSWRSNVVLVQPAAEDARTNLTMIFSDGRILQAAFVEVSERLDAGRHGQIYVGPEPWLAEQLLATVPDRLRPDAAELQLADLLAEPETLVARLEGTYVPYLAAPAPTAFEDLFAPDTVLSGKTPAPAPDPPADPPDPPAGAGSSPLALPPDFPGTVTPEDLASPPDVPGLPEPPSGSGDAAVPGAGPDPDPLADADAAAPEADGPVPPIVPVPRPVLPAAAPLAGVVAGPLPAGSLRVDPLVRARLIEREARPRLAGLEPARSDAQSFAPDPVLPDGPPAAQPTLVPGPEIDAAVAEVAAAREQLADARRAAGERVAAAALQAEQDVEAWRTELTERVQMSLVWDPPVPPWTPPLWQWGAWHDGEYTYVRMLAPDPQFYDVTTDTVVEASVSDRSLYRIPGVYSQLAISVRDPDRRGSLVQVVLRRRVELERP